MKHLIDEHEAMELEMDLSLVPVPQWSMLSWVGFLVWGFLRRALFVLVFFFITFLMTVNLLIFN